jgi:hypothetical protein
MKKILIPFFLLIISPIALAQDTDCPYGYVNESAPGTCGLYRDTDGNFVCDLSQLPESSAGIAVNDRRVYSEDELKLLSVGEMAAVYGVSPTVFASALSDFLGTSVKTTDNMGVLHDSVGLCTGVASQIASNLEAGFVTDVEEHDLVSGQEVKDLSVREVADIYNLDIDEFTAELGKLTGTTVRPTDEFLYLHDNYDLRPSVVKDLANSLSATDVAAGATVNFKPPYAFVPITLGIIILYGITYILALQKKITIVTHRKIWNIILTVTFLVSGLLGLLLVLRINYGWFADWHLFMLKWHVEFGIAMAVVSFFHMAWHWPYYRNMIKK